MEIEKILTYIDKLYEEKTKALLEAQELRKERRSYRSKDINELVTALAKAQGEMKVAFKDSENPYFKSSYADLESIVTASRASLSKNQLSVTQQIITYDDGSTSLITILAHSSGQWIESSMRVVPPKNDIQSISSYITYLKRICYAALLGVVARDEDDDGEKAVATSREVIAKGTAVSTKYAPREESHDVITREQLDELEYELMEYPDIAEMILDGLKIMSLADIPKSKYGVSIRRVREIKQTRNGK